MTAERKKELMGAFGPAIANTMSMIAEIEGLEKKLSEIKADIQKEIQFAYKDGNDAMYLRLNELIKKY